MVYSASYNNSITSSNYFMVNQLRNVILGMIVMLAVSFVDYHRVYRLGWGWGWLALIALFLIALLTPLAHSELGATRWIYLGPISFQVAEPIKACVIIFYTFFVKRIGLRTWRAQLAALLLTVAIAGLLFLLSNNLSTAVVIMGMCLVIILSMVKKPDLYIYIITFVVIALIVALALVIYILNSDGSGENFRFVRIRAWLHLEEYASSEGLQAMQARYAIGAGGFWGKGLGQSLIKFKLSYAYNDFIFAIICEELGVYGVILMMSLFGYLLYRVYRISMDAWDVEGKIIAIGVFAQIAIQLIINVMVVTSLIPTTGVTLPFFSAGGTSVVFLLAELGLVFNVDKFSKERRYLEEAERYVEQQEQRGGVGLAGWRRKLDADRTRVKRKKG